MVVLGFNCEEEDEEEDDDDDKRDEGETISQPWSSVGIERFLISKLSLELQWMYVGALGDDGSKEEET